MLNRFFPFLTVGRIPNLSFVFLLSFDCGYIISFRAEKVKTLKNQHFWTLCGGIFNRFTLVISAIGLWVIYLETD